MLSFFKNRDENEKLELEGQDSSVSSTDLLNEQSATSKNEEIHPELSFHPDWIVSKEDQYAFQFLNGECAPLKPNQVSLTGIEIQKDELKKELHVTAFIRNSLDKAISISETNLVLLDKDDKVVGRKEFDLKEVGEIPALSSRPWVFVFTEKDLFSKEVPNTGWKLAFLLEQKHKLELDSSWEKSLPEEQKDKLRQLVDQIEPPKKGEINFMGLQAQQKDEQLHVILLIRNGSEKNINLEQLPLHVEDATGEVVAKGGFKLDNLTVRANTTKPWTFIFPKEMVTKENPDLSRWKAYTPQNS
ncbi:accessory Sec system S-layer assembly protein [Halalkalibacterium ligniniphilum]|uniref:accessory Sec system S-layer assembly protein n=1 Tax=Halalkalibacterium ligniniphilum TaxID=1134413 RepID=UPI0003468AD2|nr:accessory Sec system S-layer assembly protein [Halalkalibacterium ligniniphilum]